MSKRSRSRSGVEKKAKLRRRTAKLRKRAWDFVDAFARSGSGEVFPPGLFGYGNERAHRWAMLNRIRLWKRPPRTRGRQREWDGLAFFDIDHPIDLDYSSERLATAIRRRLLMPPGAFAPDYGLPIRELLLAPEETREIEMFGRHGTLRMLDHEMAEVVLIDRPKLEKIDVTIGFENPLQPLEGADPDDGDPDK